MLKIRLSQVYVTKLLTKPEKCCTGKKKKKRIVKNEVTPSLKEEKAEGTTSHGENLEKPARFSASPSTYISTHCTELSSRLSGVEAAHRECEPAGFSLEGPAGQTPNLASSLAHRRVALDRCQGGLYASDCRRLASDSQTTLPVAQEARPAQLSFPARHTLARMRSAGPRGLPEGRGP